MTPLPFYWFICIYPSYVNCKKTLAEGRRIPAETAVENPTCAEIRHVLTVGGANVLMENEMYSREWNRDVTFRGRVRVQLKQEDGTLLRHDHVMIYCAEMIPKLKTRTGGKARKRGSSHTKSPMLLLVLLLCETNKGRKSFARNWYSGRKNERRLIYVMSLFCIGLHM
uniref:Signal recognition particle 19 kDa protein n=1 Tax=Salmo trutta TaxID=8032 RepID=A0A674CMN5_SALTR